MNHSSGPQQFRSTSPLPNFSDRRIEGLRHARITAQVLLIIADIGLLLAAFYLATEIRHGGRLGAPSWFFQSIQLIPFYLVVGLYNGNYAQQRLESARAAIKQVAITLAIAAGLRLFMTFGAKTTSEFSRAIFLMAITFGLIFLTLLRATVVARLRRRFGQHLANILVIEDGGAPVPIERAHRIVARDWDIRPDLGDPEMLDRFGRIARNMDRIIVSCTLAERQQWAAVLKGLNVRGEVVSEGLHELGALGLQREGEFTSLTVSTGPLGLKDRAMKRALDLAIAVPATILLLPVFIAVAIAIKLEDGGPVLFVQERTGRANCHFKMLKFRSMKVEKSDSKGDRSAAVDDDRVTRIGRLIRRTSLDELPQLLNVVRGDMSLVGPRPHALGSRAGGKLFWEIDYRYWHRHALKPGLTGLAQIRGHRGATDHEQHLTDRLGADLEYLDNWNPWRDIVILLRTARVLVHERAF